MKVYVHEVQPNINIKCKHKRAKDHGHDTYYLSSEFWRDAKERSFISITRVGGDQKLKNKQKLPNRRVCTVREGGIVFVCSGSGLQ